MARRCRQKWVRFYRLAVLLVVAGAGGLGDCWAKDGAHPVIWHTDYRETLAQAKANKTSALIWFDDPQVNAENTKFEAAVLGDPQVRERLASFALVKLPLDAVIAGSTDQEPSFVLLDHPAFAEMLHKPGLAIVDMRDEASPHFHHVVSVYPFVHQTIPREGLLTMLDLPSGSLTQRTLIWAVRTHREHPRSTAAECSSLLFAEAQSHAQHQASLNLQGHHNWDQRFQDINRRLGDGKTSREVCAESWPGQHLVEAAEECVHSWRQSPGHWEAVSAEHECFGYDMKRGSGGVWYATGIFGDQRGE